MNKIKNNDNPPRPSLVGATPRGCPDVADPLANPNQAFILPENRSQSGPRTVRRAWEVAAVLEAWEAEGETPREKRRKD
jgi:hypothetical protein